MRQRAVWVAAMALLVAGCSTTTVPGTAAEKVLTKAELYDPCTLPAASLIAIGLDPKPVYVDFLGVADPEWHLCLWRATAAQFRLTVLSTTHTFREVKENPRNEGLIELTLVGRRAISYFDVSDPDRRICDVAFPTVAGVVLVRAGIDVISSIKQDPCGVAKASATSLNGNFPD